MSWVPDNAELDAVARTLEPHEPPREAAEQVRTALLASAAGAPRARRARWPYALAGGALAAAAAVAVWLGTRPGEPARVVAVAPKQTITPIGFARFERVTDWPDFVVRLDDGAIAVQVAQLDAGERFRVKTADAELETRGARFDTGADQGRLASVAVKEGRVEIRRYDQQVVFLSAGQEWHRPPEVERHDEPVPAPSPPVPARVTVRDHEPVRVAQHDRGSASPEARGPKPEAPAQPDAPAPPPAPRPGEAEFRAGMAALRAGDAKGAASSFATACTIAQHDALGEDACFWSGAAAKRAGDTQSARTALAAFLKEFPSSARVPEAAALLGWIRYDAGELDAAEQLFHQAEHDRVPQVRDSAQRGLTAVDRKRRAR
jgi:TolA-binding protein